MYVYRICNQYLLKGYCYLLIPLPPLWLNIIDPLLLLVVSICLLGVIYLLDVTDAPLLIDLKVVDDAPMKELLGYTLGFRS